MGILNYKFNQLAMANEKKQTKNNQTNTTTSTKQTSNQKRKKEKKPSKRHKGDYQNKKFKHNDRKA